jgi:hypothetical protein
MMPCRTRPGSATRSPRRWPSETCPHPDPPPQAGEGNNRSLLPIRCGNTVNSEVADARRGVGERADCRRPLRRAARCTTIRSLYRQALSCVLKSSRYDIWTNERDNS